jgi:hypothetical protein
VNQPLRGGSDQVAHFKARTPTSPGCRCRLAPPLLRLANASNMTAGYAPGGPQAWNSEDLGISTRPPQGERIAS